MSLLPYLERVTEQQDLTAEEARSAMLVILNGEATSPQIASFLTALRTKGEKVHELVGFARAMREMATPVEHGLSGQTLLDTCGTGGGGPPTFNISTLVAFVVAGAGVKVAKHGNRSNSTPCGSADLLEMMGVDITFEAEHVARAIREVGIGFLFAPGAHTAMRHAAPVRRELKMRTVFNLLGPLTNPAGATVQLVGAPSPEEAELMARALAALGLRHGMVVHGSDGLDEITTTGPTVAFEVLDGKVERRELEPSDFGVRTARIEDLAGGDKPRNLGIAKSVLTGERSPCRDIVLANSAAALFVAGKVETFLEGVAVSVVSIDSGAAREKVEALIRFSKAR